MTMKQSLPTGKAADILVWYILNIMTADGQTSYLLL